MNKLTKKQKLSSWYKARRCIVEFSKIIWRENPSYYIAYIIYILTNAAAPFINIIFPKYLIDELVGNQNVRRITIYIALICLGNYLVNIIQHTTNAAKDKCSDKMEKYIRRSISLKAMKMDYQYTEDKEVLDQLEKAKTGMSWYSGGVSGILDTISEIIKSLIQLCGVSFLVIRKVPWILVVYVISISISTMITNVLNKIELKSFVKLAESNRIFSYVFWELQEIRFGKDIRLYGAEQMMEKKAEYHNNEMVDTWAKRAKESRPYGMLDGIIQCIRSVLVVLLIGIQSLAGKITLGEFYSLFYAGNTLHDSIRNGVENIQSLLKKSAYAYEYLIFMEYPDALLHGKLQVNLKQPHVIEFHNVSFQYPKSETVVLHHINVTIRQGEHVSVVGLNGAGKTTFIKLICRLYAPTEGVITLDGVDIQQYEEEEYVKLISVVFQDFEIYAFTAMENIMLADATSMISTQEQMEAIIKSMSKHKRRKMEQQLESVATTGAEKLMVLEEEEIAVAAEAEGGVNYKALSKIIRQSGLTETINQLKYGLNTYIYKRYEEDGVELSGGQKQKLAIARALYKNAPIVILDEPTAALDPIAEYEIYRQFNTLVENKTAIYISHRLSSCQFCDIIYVFEKGEIKEVGTHEQLVHKENGIYADMFLTQAQYYKKENICME